MNDWQLLQEYAATHFDRAIANLVGRCVRPRRNPALSTAALLDAMANQPAEAVSENLAEELAGLSASGPMLPSAGIA